MKSCKIQEQVLIGIHYCVSFLSFRFIYIFKTETDKYVNSKTLMHPLCGISTNLETFFNVRRNKHFQIGFTSGMFFLHMKLY